MLCVSVVDVGGADDGSDAGNDWLTSWMLGVLLVKQNQDERERANVVQTISPIVIYTHNIITSHQKCIE